jgi:hypothetical protein
MKIQDMNPELLKDVLSRVIKGWGEGSRELDCRVCFALGMDWIDPNFINPETSSWRNHIEKHGYVASWASDHVYNSDIPKVTTSIDAVYSLISEYLPQHDAIGIDRDPSGMGAYLGNWALSHPNGATIVEYSKMSHGSEVMALLAAFLTVIINIITDKSETDDEYRERRRRRE